MFESFKRSWDLTKVTIEVIKKDKELIVFPILAGIFSMIFIVAMIFPMVLSPFIFGTSSMIIGNIGSMIILFLVYLGLAFIATFFNVCVVYTSKRRFEGGNATFGESINFALSKIHIIFSWSIVAAIVGIIIRIINNIAERVGGIGELVIKMINSILGGVWGLITIFVVPGMVYHGYGPIDAIKNSAKSFKKTWGENLIRVFGYGLVEFMFFILGIVVGVMLLIISAALGSVALLLVSIFMILAYFIAVIVFFSLANTIYSTALYVYSEKGKIPHGFTNEVMAKAFTKKEKKN